VGLGCATLAIALLAGGIPASGAALSHPSAEQPKQINCNTAGLAGSGGFLGPFSMVCEEVSTVPANGDVNPYGVAVVPRTVGHLTKGDVLVSNFNNKKNLQGTGTTIVEVAPGAGNVAGKKTVFANLATQTKARVGLTTALAVFPDGYVVVGSLPTTDGTAKTATAGALYVLNSYGKLVDTIRGNLINGPWDLAGYQSGSLGVLFVTNVLNGTVAAKGKVVHKGTVVRVVLDLKTSRPKLLREVTIGSGFSERTDPMALVIGPTGVAVAPNGTVYVADTLNNRIAAIPAGTSRTKSDGTGTTVSSGMFLNQPLGLVRAPNGDLLSVNAGDGNIVETTLSGDQPQWPTIDSGGAGSLFGLAVVPGGKGVYFVDDALNRLDIFK
jgi:hypothetical protein